MSIIQGTSKAAGGAVYEIDQSIRFNDDDSAYLSRTPSSSGSATDWTLSTWLKLGNLGTDRVILSAGTGGNHDWIQFQSNDTLRIVRSGSSILVSNQVFRDPSGWGNLVVESDIDNATASEKLKVYWNGSEITSWSTDTRSSYSSWVYFNQNVIHNIGRRSGSNDRYFDGYQAEINFIDGTALDPTSFGETNDDGVWVPIAYTNAAGYGTNGFYITGEDSADLGADYSGNGNDFTSSGLATTDQMLDTPTLNFSTFNPLNVDAYTLSDGNLNTGAAGDAGAVSTFAIDVTDSDGFYFEVASSTAATYPDIGLQDADALALAGTTTISDYNTGRYTYQGNTGNFNDQGSTSSYGATYTTNTIGCLVQSGNLYFSKDGVIQNSGTAAKTGLTGMMYARVSYSAGSGTHANFTINFGQSAFTHDPGSTYKAWNTANLATPSIKDGSAYFDTSLWTGNDTDGRAITGYNFQPDWVWIKSRSGAYSHNITDAVRGAGIYLQSNASDPEVTGPGAFGSTLAFTSDGFTLDNGTSDNLYVNAGGETYVGWAWAANGAGSSNTDGSITSTVSADTTSGFSIIRWSGTGANGTIGHGLGIQPSLYIVKNTATTNSWLVGSTLYSNTQFLILNATGALDTAAAVWNSAYPTSSVINLGSNVGSNGSGTNNMICYAFAEIPGYSSIGSYIGNGSTTDGPFVYTGFKPKWIIFRSTSVNQRWYMLDVDRAAVPGANVVNTQFFAELANAESAPDAGSATDFLSNGFKLRTNGINISGQTIIYMAFAENPFGGDGVAPATAR